MPMQFADRVRETTTTTGTGTVTLAGAATGCRTFTSAISTYNTVYYVIAMQDGSAWEVGYGTLATTSTLTREVVFASSNSGALVSFASGTKDVFLDFPALSAQAVALPFGDGSDGDASVTSGTTTLTRDMHYRNLTITAGAINTAGYRIYCAGTLDISGATSASRIYVTGAAAGAISGTFGGLGGSGTVRASSGGTGGSRGYSSGTSSTSSLNGESGSDSTGWGGRGGAGGACTYARGGQGGQVGAFPYHQIHALYSQLDLSGGGGGGGAAHYTSTATYSGGGGGEGAPGIFIACRTLLRAIGNYVGTITSTGGAGTNAGVDNALLGSGGGGGGGAVVLVAGSLSGSSADDLLQSTGGAGLTSGGDGAGGYGGVVSLTVLGTNTETTAGPTANSTTTGGVSQLNV